MFSGSIEPYTDSSKIACVLCSNPICCLIVSSNCNVEDRLSLKAAQATIQDGLVQPSSEVNLYYNTVPTICNFLMDLSAHFLAFSEKRSSASRGCGNPVAKVSDHDRHVMRSSPVPPETHRVGQRRMLNLSRAETSSRWWGVVVSRTGWQLRCRPHRLIIVQNYVVRRQKPSYS
ncbi:uncharacterized protein TNCV_3360741 [Trichonephila clavipes]|nr:uncharacterized protein TNCV_3360741 [Trichonephila clavipes]